MNASPFKATDQMHGIVRMLRLAEWHDQLEPCRFKFLSVISERDALGCGTVCCARGNFPHVFPTHWKYTPAGKTPWPIEAGAGWTNEFLHITNAECEHLFNKPELHDLEKAGKFGPREWARHCREFVVSKEPSLAAILEPAPVSGMVRATMAALAK